MQVHELDTIMFELGEIFQTLDKNFKEFKPGQEKVWRNALCDFDYAMVSGSISEYVRTKTHTPKPKDIIEIVERAKRNTGNPTEEYVYRGDCELTKRALEQDYVIEQQGAKECDPKIQSAWRIYFKLTKGYFPFGEPEIPMSKSEALEIVNQQAKKHKMHEAIEERFRI